MKILLLAAIILFSAAVKLKSQQINFNIILVPNQTLIFNDDERFDKKESLIFNDCLNGVSYIAKDHLNICSTIGFQITVKLGNRVKFVGKGYVVSGLKIGSYAGTKALANATYCSDITVTDIEATLLTSFHGSNNKTVNIKVQRCDDYSFINKRLSHHDSLQKILQICYTIISA